MDPRSDAAAPPSEPETEPTSGPATDLPTDLPSEMRSDGSSDVRAVELLEAVGTVEARAFLKELASVEPQSPRSREARAARDRLK